MYLRIYYREGEKEKMENLKNTTSEAVKKANSTKRVLNKVEGITLVALVITVIIILILG